MGYFEREGEEYEDRVNELEELHREFNELERRLSLAQSEAVHWKKRYSRLTNLIQSWAEAHPRDKAAIARRIINDSDVSL